MHGAALAGMLCSLGLVLIVGTFIGAVILRAACSFYNKMNAAQNQVPEPRFGKAIGITLVTMIVNVLVGAAAGMILGGGAVAAGVPPRGAQTFSGLVALPIGFLVVRSRNNSRVRQRPEGRVWLRVDAGICVGLFDRTSGQNDAFPESFRGSRGIGFH